MSRVNKVNGSSVLEKDCSDEQSRPYSAKELLERRKNGIKRLRIGTHRVEHPECSHFYFARAGGKKEQELKESNGKNVGNCSVCWKLHKTHRNLQDRAYDLVNAYMSSNPAVFDPPDSYYNLELELDFYTWLYNEFNPEK